MMSEIVNLSQSPEERVFGNSFSFREGPANQYTRNVFYTERCGMVLAQGSGWLPRTLDADSGLTADLYKDKKIAATLVVDYGTNLTDVYITSAGGEFGDTSLCSQVAFDEAVVAAEEHVLQL